LQNIGHGLQCRIPHRVTERIIQLFESIQIQKNDANRVARAMRKAQFALHHLIECRRL
jgi:hypothetical protein